MSGGHFFSPGKSPIAMQTQPNGCGCIAISIIAEGSSFIFKHLYRCMFTKETTAFLGLADVSVLLE